MLLTSIKVKNFRSFEEREFMINRNLTVVVGDNAKGKTNLLEAIHSVLFGTGFRNSQEVELFNNAADHDDGFVEATFEDEGDNIHIYRLALQKRGSRLLKAYFIDKTRKISRDYLKDISKAVLFAPEHIVVVVGAPSRRREYLNRFISSYDLEYKRRLANYENALRRRNKILEKHTDRQAVSAELIYWDQYLAGEAAYITIAREKYMHFLAQNPTLENCTFSIKYLKNEFNKERLDVHRTQELHARRTLIGPQKDDFEITLSRGEEVKNIHIYGSRGEQRLGILWLKMNEIYIYEEILGGRPILLFDDVFSEFDQENRQLVGRLIKKYQSILTTTDAEIPKLFKLKDPSIRL